MLTTRDLAERHGYGIEVGDRVRFKLSRGLELRTSSLYGGGRVEQSRNPDSNRSVTGTIKDYKPYKPGDLEIECITDDGGEVTLLLNRCRDLKILGPALVE